ncbi:LOW QUALITY PROTEIN: DNA repair protein RAD50-like [Liolophura sinensis]|uniref:LOW QUALITY PROTEIN: DNA repair protein RAD50-like n=1 Tax=Liolophura sinensis TaxID=3198878 RepID=UPI0031588860
MSSIQKMAIQGVRSFGPEDKDKQVITFFTPLTLILGPNGTGKTTIIECLKYITTGDMPPGCKGFMFIHDPKVANEREVKGQVKLLFQDVSGKQCIVERSMIVQQKAKTLTFKTLDGIITRLRPDGSKISTTSKCLEIDREMVTSLGVSKPVLENVIFCHQEDSNWPLSEGKALKDKFDAIFASTRYVKALEAIRKLKQSQDIVLKEYRAEMKYLRQNKEKAAQIAGDLAETEQKFAASRESLHEYDEQMAPIEEKLNKIYDATHNINKLSSQKGKMDGEKEMLEKTINEIIENLENEFQGPTEELEQILSEFQNKLEETNKTVAELEKKLSRLNHDLDKVNEERSKIDVDVGKMEQAAADHENHIRRRDASLRQLASEYGFEGFSRGEITLDRYQQFEERVRERIEENVEKHNHTKDEYEKEEANIQRKINTVRERATKVEHDIQTKKDTSKKNIAEMREISRKLSEVDASAGKLEQINQDLKKAERDLQATEGSVNIDDLKADISSLQKEKQTLDATLSALSSEMSRLHMESSLLTEVNMLKKEKTSKEEGVRKIKAKHEDTLKYLLGHMPAQNVRGELDEYTGRQSEDVKNMERSLQRNKMELTTKEANRKMIKEQLKKKEEELKTLEEKIFEVCGSQNFEESLTTVQKKMGQTQDQRGSLLGAQHFFKKYVEDLKKNNPCCPLCHREFDEEQEVRELVLELQQKLRMVPGKVETAEKELKDYQQRYDSMLQLRPLRASISTLKDADIPEMKTKLSRVGTEVETLQQTIQEKEEDLQSKHGDLSMAKEMAADIILMDRYLGDIRDVDKRIIAKSAKLSVGDSDRTMEKVNDEKEEAQIQLENVNRKLDYKREKVSSHSDQVQRLKGQVNDLTADKLRIEQDVQQRCKLEERKVQLEAENNTLVLDIQDQEDQLGPLKLQIDRFEEDKKAVSREKDDKLNEIKSEGESTRTKCREVHAINKLIKGYIRESRAEALQSKKELQVENAKRVENLTSEQQDIRSNLDKLRTELANQQVREREFQDNLQLREKQKEMERLQGEIDKLMQKIGGFDPKGLNRERQKLEEKKDELRNRKNQVEGRQRGFLDEIKRFKQELKSDQYNGAAEKCRDKAIALRTTELANLDLEKYYKALDRAIMSYHSMKMPEINKIIRELWRNTYRGNDIETIEIRSDEDDSGAMKARRVYHYRVVMVKGTTDLDMRGRCSAGQKVLASLIIRLALAETFCLNCGILALDEPTTNLDRENIESLAFALVEIIKSRSQQRNFQLVVITHDEDFVELLGRSDYVEDFYRIRKNAFGCSQISCARVADLHVETR